MWFCWFWWFCPGLPGANQRQQGPFFISCSRNGSIATTLVVSVYVLQVRCVPSQEPPASCFELIHWTHLWFLAMMWAVDLVLDRFIPQPGAVFWKTESPSQMTEFFLDMYVVSRCSVHSKSRRKTCTFSYLFIANSMPIACLQHFQLVVLCVSMHMPCLSIRYVLDRLFRLDFIHL